VELDSVGHGVFLEKTASAVVLIIKLAGPGKIIGPLT
jgi:hypothetical protein